MASATLAEVIRRETTVRRNRALLEPRPPSSARPAIGPAWVPIDWVRGSDSGQRIRAVGSDGFEITGVGAGFSHRGGASSIDVGLERRIHRVRVRSGAGPPETLQALIDGLARYYRVEIIEISTHSATARIVDHRRCHT